MSTCGLDLVLVRLDNMDVIFTKNSVVDMEDTAIAELIECVLEGTPLTVRPIPIVATMLCSTAGDPSDIRNVA